MASEPDGPAHLYRALKGRLKNNDREGAIELYYELLSSGRTVGEILDGAGPVRRGSDYPDTAAAQRLQSGAAPGQAAAAFSPELAATAPENVNETDGRGVSDNMESCRIGKPIEQRGPPPDTFGSDQRERNLPRGLPASESHVVILADIQTSRGREAAADPDNRKRFRSRRFSNIATSIAFWALYTGAVAAASIAGFSLLRGGDTEPAITADPLSLSRGAETGGAADRPEAVAKAVLPQTQPAHAGEPQAPGSPQSGEPIPALVRPAAPIPVGAQGTASAVRQPAEASPLPDAGQPDAFEQLIEQLADPAAHDPGHDPAAAVTRSASEAPTGTAAAELRADAGRPQTVETPSAAVRGETQAEAAAPVATVPAALPPGAQAAGKPGEDAPGRNAGSQQTANRRTAARRPPQVTSGRQGSASNPAARNAGTYPVDPARAYGYGAYGPAPYSETGD